VLISVIAAVAVPRFFDELVFSQRGYADEIASTLRLARRVAIASECEVRVTLAAANYVANQRPTPLDCDTASGAWITPVHRSDGSPLAGTAPTGITLAPASVIVFNREGGTTALAADLTIGPFTVSIDAVSGNVTVSP
jgi:MSHA pilin protein MshC